MRFGELERTLEVVDSSVAPSSAVGDSVVKP